MWFCKVYARANRLVHEGREHANGRSSSSSSAASAAPAAAMTGSCNTTVSRYSWSTITYSIKALLDFFLIHAPVHSGSFRFQEMSTAKFNYCLVEWRCDVAVDIFPRRLQISC